MIIKVLALVAILAFAAAFTTIKYEAEVVEVTDGDTLIVRIAGFPAPFDPITVRIYGIDTPESRLGVMGAKCAKEKKLGLEVKAWLKAKLPAGTKVDVIWTGIREKYGRLLGNVVLNKEDIAQTLIKKGYAVSYFGKTKSDWCKK